MINMHASVSEELMVENVEEKEITDNIKTYLSRAD
jgi:hypothetical protein